jgi:hypothetical protein
MRKFPGWSGDEDRPSCLKDQAAEVGGTTNVARRGALGRRCDDAGLAKGKTSTDTLPRNAASQRDNPQSREVYLHSFKKVDNERWLR